MDRELKNLDFYKITNMHDGETIYLNESDDGGAEIHKYRNIYFLFEIPQFGDYPQYCGHFTDINEMIDTYSQWC